MSPSPSSNSTRRESQKLVEPSFTWKAMFLPPYLHAVLQRNQTNATRHPSVHELAVTPFNSFLKIHHRADGYPERTQQQDTGGRGCSL